MVFVFLYVVVIMKCLIVSPFYFRYLPCCVSFSRLHFSSCLCLSGSTERGNYFGLPLVEQQPIGMPDFKSTKQNRFERFRSYTLPIYRRPNSCVEIVNKVLPYDEYAVGSASAGGNSTVACASGICGATYSKPKAKQQGAVVTHRIGCETHSSGWQLCKRKNQVQLRLLTNSRDGLLISAKGVIVYVNYREYCVDGSKRRMKPLDRTGPCKKENVMIRKFK